MKKRTTLRNVAFLLAMGSAAAMVAGHVAGLSQNAIQSVSSRADSEVKYSTYRLEAEDATALYDTYHYDSAINASELANGETGMGLNSCWDTNFAVYENVDFLDGAVEVTVRKNLPRASAMEMWIDPVIDSSSKSFTGGTKIVDMEFSLQSMGWTVWENFTAPVEGLPQGMHTLVVKFKTAGSTAHNQNLAAVNWYEFKLIDNREDLQSLVAVEKNVTVEKFSTVQLAFNYVPEKVFQKDVEWSVVSSTPEDAVELNQKGEVTGLKKGNAVVRATSTWNSSIYAEFNVEVTDIVSEGPIVIEGENWTDSYECAQSTLNGEGSEASGGKGWKSDNAHKNAWTTYKFYTNEAGAYDLSVWYVTMNTRWISVQINDQPAHVICCDILTGNWNGAPSADAPGVAHKNVTVYCREGENILTVRPMHGYSPEPGVTQPYSPSVDRFELVKSDVEMEEPEAQKIICDVDDYTNLSNSKVDDRVALDPKRGLVISGNGVASYEVNAPVEGVYCMNINYVVGDLCWISVTVNGATQYVSFLEYVQGAWGQKASDPIYQRQVLVYLQKGVNYVDLGQYKKLGGSDASKRDNSPVIGRMTYELVSYPDMQVPEMNSLAYSASMADVVKWNSTFNDNAFNDHSEFTTSVSDSNEATVTGEFPWPVMVTGYAFATQNDAKDWTVEVSANGENWKTLVATTTSSRTVFVAPATKGNLTTVEVEKPYGGIGAMKYVRLNIKGSEAAVLSEFCVFGNPYVSEECHVPAGLLTPGATDYESSHPGFDTQTWHEGIDKLFNGICTDRFTVAKDGDGSMGDFDDITIDVYLSEAAVVKSYMVSTHYTTRDMMNERNPTAWELYRGPAPAEVSLYEAGDEWTRIDSREGMNFVVPGSSLVMNADNETESDSYRFVIKNRRGMATHLAALQLFAKDVTTGIEAAEAEVADAVMVSGGKGVIEIAATAEKAYAVYTTTGVMVAAGEVDEAGVSIDTAQGIYVVAVGNKAVKVLVK